MRLGGGVRGAWVKSKSYNVAYPWATVCSRAQGIIKETII